MTKATPKLQRLVESPTRFTGGVLRDRVHKNLHNLLSKIDLAHFERTYAELHEGGFAEPEFAGQFIDASVAAWRYTGESFFLDRARAVVESILRHQRGDGYLGTYKPGLEFDPTFSVWNQQFSIMGLLSFYEATRESPALDAATRCADYLVTNYLRPGGPKLLHAINQGIENSCILIEFVRLYELTGKQTYLDFAEWIVEQWESSTLRLISATQQREHVITSVGCLKAAEILICYRGLLHLARVTGNQRYFDAVRRYWDVVHAMQIGPTGNGSIAETWTFLGNQPVALCNDIKPNENCVAVTWIQLTGELLSVTGESRYADAFERTLYNHLLGAQAIDGSDFSYYQGNEGRKVHRTPSHWYSCCRFRGMKMLTRLGEYVVQQTDDGLAVALYAESTTRATVNDVPVELKQTTQYPRTGEIRIDVRPARDATFSLRLRRPAYAGSGGGIGVRVNGQSLRDAPTERDGFVTITRPWRAAGNRVDVSIPMSMRQTRAVVNDRPCVLSEYGPLVLAIDTREGTPLESTALDVNHAVGHGEDASGCSGAHHEGSWVPIVRLRAAGRVAGHAGEVTLVDYASAGSTDLAIDCFRVWVPVA